MMNATSKGETAYAATTTVAIRVSWRSSITTYMIRNANTDAIPLENARNPADRIMSKVFE
jgi:hypothetical protein